MTEIACDLTPAQLTAKKCVPCEGGIPKFTPEQAARQLTQLDGWRLTADGQRLAKEWTMRNFMAGMEFFQAVAQLAEAEGHHPDLHLTRYRQARIEIYTHAIGGLSENDFILAAKIDALPLASNASAS
ncbi:MAG: 4a-hydroxytetrahydrobiopterin dehydratase [Pirellulales bacterium]|nr:4a-hydroxytetrahydrobiopterin dehydratase [Pirellulales bacterium]